VAKSKTLKSDPACQDEACRLYEKGIELVDSNPHDLAGQELIRQAAELGYVRAVYRWGAIRYYTYEDYAEAQRYFQMAAAEDFPDAVYHLGLMYELGQIKSPRASREPRIAHVQNLAEAEKWYQRAIELNHWVAHLRYGRMLIKGVGVIKDYSQGRRHILRSAQMNYPPAMVEYARLSLNGRVQAADPLAAYVWGVLSADPEGVQLAEEVEKKLQPEEISAGQNEAKRLRAILGKRYLEDADLEEMETRLAPLRSEAPSHPTKGGRSALLPWKVSDIRDLSLRIFPKEKKVTFSLRGDQSCKTTLILRQAFTPKFSILLQNYHQIALLDQRPVLPRENTLLNGIRCQRDNQQAVADFNHYLRRILNLDAKVRAFVWIGKGREKRTLRALFDLRVEYLSPHAGSAERR